MRIASIFVLLGAIAACQPNQTADVAKSSPPQSTSPLPTVEVDISTPDRALKSYWRARDALRKAEFDWGATHLPDLTKFKAKLGVQPQKLTTSDVLAAFQERERPGRGTFEEYSREIVDIKQDTESRATAIVKIRNSTPMPQGAVLSESDKRQRDEGEKVKYILEKDGDGWKIAQVYKFDEFRMRVQNKDPWDKIFSPPSDRPAVHIWVNPFDN